MIQLAVARISSPGFGTAFAIDATTAMTAFHCIRDETATGTQPIDSVELRFLSEQTVTARAVDFNPVHDWAVLKLDEPLSEDSRPIPLTGELQLPGDRCRCLGFPGRGEVGYLPILATVAGETSRTGVAMLALEVGPIAAGLDARGLSGGPVLRLNSRDDAVGLVSARLLDPVEEEQVGGVIFACPTRHFEGASVLATPEIAPSELGLSAEPLPGVVAPLADVSSAARYGQLLHSSGDDEQARPWLELAAQGGDPTAAFTLGLLLDPTGDLIKHDPDGAQRALTWFRRAATGGDVYGATTMGIRLHQHDRDDAALPWLEEAVERGGDAMAAHTLGRIYDKRHKLDLTVHWEHFAAERGDVRAAYDLGRILNDRGERDEAIHWLQQATIDPDAVSLLRKLGVEPVDGV